MKKRKHRKVKLHKNWHRQPGGQKYRGLPGIRPGARPPNSWDDLPGSKSSKSYIRHLNAMIAKGWDIEIILEKLEAKWGVPKWQSIDEVIEQLYWEEYRKGFTITEHEELIKEARLVCCAKHASTRFRYIKKSKRKKDIK